MGNTTVSGRNPNGKYYVGEEKLNGRRRGRKKESEDSRRKGNIGNGEQNMPRYRKYYY